MAYFMVLIEVEENYEGFQPAFPAFHLRFIPVAS
jgi:hypothetical protein